MYDGAESGVLMTASSSINETGLQKQQGAQTLWQRIMHKVFKVSTQRGRRGTNSRTKRWMPDRMSAAGCG